jgi:hypothetical protein
MPWHVATLIGRKKGRGGERERGRMKKEFKDKRKNYRMRSSRGKTPLRMTEFF